MLGEGGKLDSEPRRSVLQRLRLLLSGKRTDSAKELEREIQGLVDQGEAQGLISPGEGDMIEAILELNDTIARQIMVPRTEMAVLPVTAAIEEVIAVIVESGHSRIPVYEDDLDHIMGVVLAKDLLPFWGRPSAEFDIRQIARPPLFVPQSMPVNELLAQIKRRRVHLAVVVDEYGGTAGIATIEDVLEEIVGEIVDEHDQEEPLVSQQADGSYLVNARMEMDDLSDLLGVELPEKLPEGRFETLGGFLITLLGRVPRPQEEVTFGQVHMVVLEAEDRRVVQVRVSLLPAETQLQA